MQGRFVITSFKHLILGGLIDVWSSFELHKVIHADSGAQEISLLSLHTCADGIFRLKLEASITDF